MNLTANKLLAGLSLGSMKPKSEVVSVYGVLSLEKTVVGVPIGAWFTPTTFVSKTRDSSDWTSANIDTVGERRRRDRN